MDFMNAFEKKVENTIKKYNLLNKKEKVLVACSGGKDSTVILYILDKLGYNVQGLIVDLEIGNYSKINIENIRGFCQQHGLKLNETSFNEEFGYSKCKLESALKEKGTNLNSCSICGVLRRYLLNKKAREMKVNKIVTGHNLDDEAQAIMMNFFRNTMTLQSRLGPVSGNIKDKKFIQRVKPLYFHLESDIKKYSQTKKLKILYDRCPCITNSFRNKVRNILNNLKDSDKIKQNIVNNFLKQLPKLKQQQKTTTKILACIKCNEPSSKDVCTTCKIIETLK
jgi:uncharacterized protein (TIGR00269 family)